MFTVIISSSPMFAAIERDRHALVCIMSNYSASDKVNYMLYKANYILDN